MGKKQKVQVDSEDEDNILNDADFEAEMKALESMRAEREAEERKLILGAGAESVVQSNKAYNREGLLKCLQDLDTAELPFVQTLRIEEFDLQISNELDDVEREMNFYSHALSAVQVGRAKLQELGYPLQRPNDFFCEQVKSDAHMTRIKDRLLIEEKRMEAFEQRKNREQNRKYNKQLVLMKKETKNKEKKQLLDEIDELKEQSREQGAEKTHSKYLDKNASMSKDEKLEKILKNHDDKSSSQSKKRKIMDSKYGFGGKDRKKSKQNDAKSLNDFSDFNPRGGKFIRNRTSTGGKGKKVKNYRPGKDARQKSRSGKRGN